MINLKYRKIKIQKFMFTNPSDANHFLRSLFWTLVYENKIINIKQYFFIFRILMIKKEKRNK